MTRIKVFFLFYKVFMLFYEQASCKLLGHMETGLLVPVSERVLRSLRF